MTKYLDRNRVKIEFHKLGHYTDQACREFLVNDIDELVNQICKLKPKKQVVIARGKVIIKHCPDRTINVFLNTLKDWLEKLDGRKVKIILEEE